MDSLNIDKFSEMIRAAYEAICLREDELSRLDAVIGDGDHGTAIVQALSSVAEKLDGATDFKQLLKDAGFNVMMKTSGSTSTLLGSLLLGMSSAVDGTELSINDVKDMFSAGLTGVQKQTKAAVGDKTMMDALVPAVEAIRVNDSGDMKSLFNSAAQAALKGAASTVEMKANFGRARNYGERSIGHADSGATSWAAIFEAFAKAV